MAILVVGSTSGVPVPANMLFLLLDSEDDVPNLLTDYASASIGSRAFTANLGYQSVKGGDGIWHERAVVEAAEAANEAAEAANGAASLANEKAGLADDAATAANAAAAGAVSYAQQYAGVDADLRLIFAQFQAYARYLEKRITTLEAQVAALAGA